MVTNAHSSKLGLCIGSPRPPLQPRPWQTDQTLDILPYVRNRSNTSYSTLLSYRQGQVLGVALARATVIIIFKFNEAY